MSYEKGNFIYYAYLFIKGLYIMNMASEKDPEPLAPAFFVGAGDGARISRRSESEPKLVGARIGERSEP